MDTRQPKRQLITWPSMLASPRGSRPKDGVNARALGIRLGPPLFEASQRGNRSWTQTCDHIRLTTILSLEPTGELCLFLHS